MPLGKWSANVAVFGLNNSLSRHSDNKKKHPGKGTTDKLDDTKYSVNITKSRNKSCLSLHCNVANSFLCANNVKISQFKSMNSKMEPYSLCLRNILNGFTFDNM